MEPELTSINMNALIVGKGAIGSFLGDRLVENGWQVSFLTSSESAYFHKRVRGADVVFVAISTRDDGSAARAYIEGAREHNIPVVTCEKGSLANHFDALKPHLSQIGFTATVGGGSKILSLVTGINERTTRLLGILNGTLNFLFWKVGNKHDPHEVFEEAQKKGLCEPGNHSLAEAVHGELNDVKAKAAILFNVAGLSAEPLRPTDFSYSIPSAWEIARLLDRAGNIRFVVEIFRDTSSNHRFDFEVFQAKREGWLIRGNFVRIDTSNDDVLRGMAYLTREEKNTLIVEDSSGNLEARTGVGAGLEPTTSVMIEDAYRLLGLQKHC
ncbi:MAG: hypothetical protein FJY98_03110 [Candidatus Liptonbacteria bacterium]|nr:hypothetical protein [Candidatus Liptonbacteria bacterium]